MLITRSFRAKKGRPGITVCWYFRPEQTFHPTMRQFWENEIFKTSARIGLNGKFFRFLTTKF